MDYLIRLSKSGERFPSKDVSNGYIKGVFCLRCGKFTGGGLCGVCKDFERCNSCSIICRPVETYKVYNYVKTPDVKGFSDECFQEVKPFCQELINGRCLSCIEWHNTQYNVCFKCNVVFKNTKKHFKKYGNNCLLCIK